MPLLLPKQLLAGASWREARMGGDAALVSVAACTLLAMYLVRRAFGDLGGEMHACSFVMCNCQPVARSLPLATFNLQPVACGS